MRARTNSAPAPSVASEKSREMQRSVVVMPDLEQASLLLQAVGNVTILKLLALLEREPQLRVAELAARVGVSLSGVSQHLGKLRLYGLVTFERDAQSRHYRLTDHPFLEKLRAVVFEPSGRPGLASRSSIVQRGSSSRRRSGR